MTVADRDDFPSDTHRLLLNVAANQATLALLTDHGPRRGAHRRHAAADRHAVAAEMDPEKVIQTVTDEATALTGANFGAFFYNVVNAAGESYMLYTLSGAPREAFSRFPMPRNTAIFGPTFDGSGVVRLSDVTADPRFGHNPPYHGMPAGHLPVRSYLAVPVCREPAKCMAGCSSDTRTSACSPSGTSAWPSASRHGPRSPWTTVISTPKRSAPTWRRISSSPRCRTSCARR